MSFPKMWFVRNGVYFSSILLVLLVLSQPGPASSAYNGSGNTDSELTEISSVYANLLISDHGGRNGTLSHSDLIHLIRHLHGNNGSQLGTTWVSSPTNDSRRGGFIDCTSHPDLYHIYPEICNATDKCHTSRLLLNLLNVGLNDTEVQSSNQRLPPTVVDAQFLQAICPVLLHQLESTDCLDINLGAVMETAVAHNKPTPLEVWGYGFLFVTVISLSSVFGAVLLPMMDKKFYHRLLIVLVGLAVGSLSGSAAFHLMPQAFGLLNNKGDHTYLWTSLLVLSGMYLFFMVERLLKIYIEHSKLSRGVCQESLKRNHSDVQVLSYKPVEELRRNGSSSYELANKNDGHKHEHHIDFKQGQDSAIATVAWMIVFGDGLHNFIDGLSIGAAFNQSILTGISISVAVVCEELPHELGDLAILLNSGMTMKQALLYNFLSACTCYLGLIVGTLLGELAEASMYIFALAAGAFFYISLVDMVPEMNAEVENASRESVWEAVKVLMLQNIGWITGTAILFTLAYFTDQLSFE